VDGQPPTLWQTPPATATEITDENVQAGNYLYLIRAIDANGKNSKTKSVTVKW
jgi:predicted phage tail protein